MDLEADRRVLTNDQVLPPGRITLSVKHVPREELELHIAFFEGAKKFAKVLLENGADDTVLYDGKTVYEIARDRGFDEMTSREAIFAQEE